MTKCVRKKFRLATAAASCLLFVSAAWADRVTCDMSAYKAQPGITAASTGDSLAVTWNGDGDQEVRLTLAVNSGTPTVKEIALRHGRGAWTTLASNVTPDFAVMTGLRRMSNQQLEPLYGLGMKITQDVLNKYRWEPFWDAPFDLSVPKPGANATSPGNPPPVDGLPGTDQPGLPRKPDEIQRATAVYTVTSCTVKTDGARLEINYPGVKLGLFDGSLHYTVFKGTNLIRQEVIAATHAPWVAYKYDAGLKGLPIQSDSQVLWRDTANNWQSYAFGGHADTDLVPLAATNRVVLAEQGKSGSIAAFPPPHKFFWSREVAINMGYNWYRKDSDSSYSVGIRQNEHEDLSQGQGNWALYSARPGTQQLMTVFLYPALSPGKDAVNQVLAFTHDDHYKPLPGYEVMQHHYHMDLGQRLLEANNLSILAARSSGDQGAGYQHRQPDRLGVMSGFSATGAATAPPSRPANAGGGRRSGPSQVAITAASVEGRAIPRTKDSWLWPIRKFSAARWVAIPIFSSRIRSIGISASPVSPSRKQAPNMARSIMSATQRIS